MSRKLIVVLALLLTACGTATSETTPASTTSGINLGPDQKRVSTGKVDRIAAEVPEPIRARGTLEVVADAGTVPPLSFYATDDHTPIGVEEDIASLVADVLGLKPHYTVVSWENIFVGLDSGKYDAGFSNITVTEARKEKYDFATYRLDNVSFEARKGSGWQVNGPADVAGRSIAVSSGTNQEKLLLDWNAQNTAKGLKPVDVKYFQKATDYYLALQSGRIDAYFGPNPSTAYHAATSGQTELIGTVSGAGTALQGKIAATTKKDNGLIRALHEALSEVIANGSYAQVLRRWGLSNEAVTGSELNPPGLPRT
ncbi:ABC transporter substrate-binding protein [Kutzneria viridogrisea]|uniref:ABC amino acid transporter n=2 Tax=Kutzneria TaxID=43356 RepID=W5W1N4_9PSEU|nr:ABC transporter substrate-binding protein [Kutzneria albida]AHH94747.1 ABC amino acid transporter [Kutzneria albida DSM 43870]MBA8930416.1 polar amino acid transport system substrate-binding protein [Kutzneria viridogrisea]